MPIITAAPSTTGWPNRPHSSSPWRLWGPVSGRPAVGDGPRGLLGRRRRLVLLPVRAVPRPRLPLGRGRARRDLRPLRLPELRDRDVERARPDPQGARLRPDQRPGQPRRGRQGVLVAARRRRRPTRGCSGSTATRRPSSPISSCATRTPGAASSDREYELADTGVLDDNRFFDVAVTYAKAAPDDICIVIEATNHGPDAAPLHLLPHVWFRNTWVWGRDARKPQPAAGRPAAAGRRPPARGRLPARLPRPLHPRRRPRPARADRPRLRQRDQRRRAVRHRPDPESERVHQGRHQQPGRARRRVGREPGRARHQGRVLVLLRLGRAGPDGEHQAAALDRNPPDEFTFGSGFDAVVERPPRRGGRVLRPSASPPTSTPRTATSPAARSPACCGTSSSTATTSSSGSRAIRPTPPPPASRSAPGARNVALAAPRPGRRDLDARRMGVPVVRRVGPRLPLRAARPRRSDVRQGAAGPAVPGMGHASRTGSCRRTSGPFPMSIRPSTRGRRCRSTRSTDAATATS